MAAMYTAAELLALARAYDAVTGCGLSAIGRRAAGNDRVLVRLEAGHGCHIATAERLSAWFDAHWPEAAARPVPVRARAAKSPGQG
jgi:aminoglycoside phosphotransferase (APT) family kinase protein